MNKIKIYAELREFFGDTALYVIFLLYILVLSYIGHYLAMKFADYMMLNIIYFQKLTTTIYIVSHFLIMPCILLLPIPYNSIIKVTEIFKYENEYPFIDYLNLYGLIEQGWQVECLIINPNKKNIEVELGEIYISDERRVIVSIKDSEEYINICPYIKGYSFDAFKKSCSSNMIVYKDPTYSK